MISSYFPALSTASSRTQETHHQVPKKQNPLEPIPPQFPPIPWIPKRPSTKQTSNPTTTFLSSGIK